MSNIGIYCYFDPTKPGKYCYTFPEIGELVFDYSPFYIGYTGSTKGSRPLSHWNWFIKSGKHSNYMMREEFVRLKSLGKKPIISFILMTIAEPNNYLDLSRDYFLGLEEPFIQVIGRKVPLRLEDNIGPLCNIAEGGGKFPVFEELPENSKERVRERWEKGFTLEQCVEGGRTAGRKNWRTLVAKTTNEQRSKAGKIGGKVGGKIVGPVMVKKLIAMNRERHIKAYKNLEQYKDMVLDWLDNQKWSLLKIIRTLNEMGVERETINSREVPRITNRSIRSLIKFWRNNY